jgi:hypothetical protein
MENALENRLSYAANIVDKENDDNICNSNKDNIKNKLTNIKQN